MACLVWPAGFVLLAVGALAFSLTIGRYPVTVAEILRFLAAAAGFVPMEPARFDALYNVLVEIRGPRVLAALVVGASLACSGAAFQAVFRNPLVSPGLMGALGGAAFGAALGLLLDAPWAAIQALSFVMGLLAVGLGVSVATLFGGGRMIMLVLGGMISSALFASLLSMVKFVADPTNQLPSIVYWLMGNLGMASLRELSWLAPPMLLAVLVLCGLGRALDALAMGDDEARALGVPVNLVRYGVIAAATLASALTVSVAGIVGWIGLIVPHLARLILGPANGRLLPASALLGASFLIGADCLARSVAATEIPVGIVTELLGVPAFLLVLHRAGRGWR